MFANSGDPDQTPLLSASDLVLHCLPMSQKMDATLIWVKTLHVVREPRLAYQALTHQLMLWVRIAIDSDLYVGFYTILNFCKEIERMPLSQFSCLAFARGCRTLYGGMR